MINPTSEYSVIGKFHISSTVLSLNNTCGLVLMILVAFSIREKDSDIFSNLKYQHLPADSSEITPLMCHPSQGHRMVLHLMIDHWFGVGNQY